MLIKKVMLIPRKTKGQQQPQLKVTQSLTWPDHTEHTGTIL